MTRILCLWFPNWPIQQLLRSRPELQGRPVALVSGDPRGSSVVLSWSKALAQGVQPGMPLAEAQALVRDLMVVPYDLPAYRRELAKLAACCERFTPFVALEEGDAPESLLLDLSNLEHLYGSETRLVAQIEKFFTGLGYEIRLAVAHTVGLAWALAHAGDGGSRLGAGESRESRAEGREPEDQFAISNSPVPSPQPPAAYLQLPAEALRIPQETSLMLRDLGIQTIGQLLALPREDLSSRFGENLLRRIDQLTGAAPEMIEPHRPPAALRSACALEEPTADRAMLVHVLGELVGRLTRELAVRDEGAVALVCLLYAPASHAIPLRIGLLEPTTQARQIMELIELRLETLTLTNEVDHMEVQVPLVGRLSERQRELFVDRWQTNPHQLALLVNRLSSRLGDQRVLRAELRKSPVPERAVRWEPMNEWRGTKRKDRGTRRQGDKRNPLCRSFPSPLVSISPCPPPRPMLLHPQPQPVEVVCISPDGPPRFLWLENRRERIVECAGPERIETLWWRGPAIRRDYYRAATESGRQLWLFRRRNDTRWFLHGIFT